MNRQVAVDSGTEWSTTFVKYPSPRRVRVQCGSTIEISIKDFVFEKILKHECARPKRQKVMSTRMNATPILFAGCLHTGEFWQVAEPPSPRCFISIEWTLRFFHRGPYLVGHPQNRFSGELRVLVPQLQHRHIGSSHLVPARRFPSE